MIILRDRIEFLGLIDDEQQPIRSGLFFQNTQARVVQADLFLREGVRELVDLDEALGFIHRVRLKERRHRSRKCLQRFIARKQGRNFPGRVFLLP